MALAKASGPVPKTRTTKLKLNLELELQKMSNTVNAVTAAIAQAQANAAAAIQQQTQAMTAPVMPAAPQAVATYTRPGAPIALEEMTGAINVDGWIGVKEFGFTVGPEKKLFTDGMLVEINLDEVAYCYAVKYGNPAVYLKTYDRVTEVKGGTWADAVALSKRANPDIREYPSCDIPMKLLSQVAIQPKGGKGAAEVIYEPGVTLGTSMSTTNFPLWKSFAMPLKKNGATIVQVILGVQSRKNTAGNSWGVMTFELAPSAA